MRNEVYGRCPATKSRNPYTCGLTGKTYTTAESSKRTDLLAKGLAKVLGWEPNVDLAWDKVIAVFSFNTVCLALRRIKEGTKSGKELTMCCVD